MQGDEHRSRKERDETNLLWPSSVHGVRSLKRHTRCSWEHKFSKKGKTQICFGLFQHKFSRTDDKDESERSLSSSYLPFSLLGGYGVDLPLRRSRCSCFLVTHEHTDCQQGPGAAIPHDGNFDLLDGGRGSRGEL